MNEFPEPIWWNGDDDEGHGYIGRRTGPRREPDVTELRRCHHCTKPLHWTDRGGRGPIQILDVGEFCSERCHQAATANKASA